MNIFLYLFDFLLYFPCTRNPGFPFSQIFPCSGRKRRRQNRFSLSASAHSVHLYLVVFPFPGRKQFPAPSRRRRRSVSLKPVCALSGPEPAPERFSILRGKRKPVLQVHTTCGTGNDIKIGRKNSPVAKKTTLWYALPRDMQSFAQIRQFPHRPDPN